MRGGSGPRATAMGFIYILHRGSPGGMQGSLSTSDGMGRAEVRQTKKRKFAGSYYYTNSLTYIPYYLLTLLRLGSCRLSRASLQGVEDREG